MDPAQTDNLEGAEGRQVGPKSLNRSEPDSESISHSHHLTRPHFQSSGAEPPVEERPPPAFGDQYGQVDFTQHGFNTNAKVATDGRLEIKIKQHSRRLSELLEPVLRDQYQSQPSQKFTTHHAHKLPSNLVGVAGEESPPPLNVVIHVVGSRGDVQPFVALGKVLKEEYNHRVRLATHSTFKGFVEENGLEHFNIGGDPAELMAFMVKNPGLLPGVDTIKSGDIGRRRRGMYEILQGCWRSCFEFGDGTGVPVTDETLDPRTSFDSGVSMGLDNASKPFVADAIIANPPSFAHMHCAEKLGIPLHLMFTMPWSPTQAFPHPLANIESSNADDNLTNFVSYALVEMMTWQGLGDMINRFREKCLNLEPVSLLWAPGMATRLRIPYTYCWSPALIPKPQDWGTHIDISGFYFLSLASSFTPDAEIEKFLDAGPPPVYIGFGSIVVDDPNAMTDLIFEAVRKTGQRALVSKGWGGFGADSLTVPDNIMMLGNVPHDWLFKRVSCVVHHGGAGTTAAGIALGKPTVIVPFFGDQPFWGAMVANAGAGPRPVPNKTLTAQGLADAILKALEPSTVTRAQELGQKIASEHGTLVGAKSFHRQLAVDTLRCDLSPRRAATWRLKRTNFRMSAFAASVLVTEGLLELSDLKLYRPREYDTEDGPWDPVTGGASALIGTMGSLAMGVADLPVDFVRTMKSRSNESTSDLASLKPVSSESALGSKGDVSPKGHDDSAATTRHNSFEIPTTQQLAAGDDPISPQSSHENRFSRRSMAQAIRGSYSRSTSRSRKESSPDRRTLESAPHPHRHNSAHSTVDAAVGASKNIGRIVGVGLKSPMDFTLSIARGFHNAPKLYGDESVRQAGKVTDMQSGLKVAGKEFTLGMYDGITGLVTQPFDGARREGVAGFVKGIGKGLGGVVLKPSGAIWALPGYTFKGIFQEIQKHFGASCTNYIIAARTAQGLEELTLASVDERQEVVRRWTEAQPSIWKQRSAKERALTHNLSSSRSGSRTDHDPKKHSHFHFTSSSRSSRSPSPKSRSKKGSVQDPTVPSALATKTSHDDVEHAIQQSVASTSKGDPHEDKMIERAIRASLKELQNANHGESQQDLYNRAIHASIQEAKRASSTQREGTVTSPSEEQELAQSLHRSLREHDLSGATQALPQNQSSQSKEELEMQRTLSLSKETHDQHQQELKRDAEEEDAVMSYVQKLSLLEKKEHEHSEADHTL